MSANQCRTCRHFLELPMGKDPKLYFCENPRTKEGPSPIGFIDHDAPACALYESREETSRSTVIILTGMPGPERDNAALIENRAVKWALLLSTLVGLSSWLYSHIPPPLIASVRAKLGL